MFGKVTRIGEQWSAKYRGKRFQLKNEFNDYRHLVVGRDENKLIHFNKDREVERIGAVTPLMIESFQNFGPVQSWRLKTKNGVPTITVLGS